jgi:hypothetical protein
MKTTMNLLNTKFEDCYKVEKEMQEGLCFLQAEVEGIKKRQQILYILFSCFDRWYH